MKTKLWVRLFLSIALVPTVLAIPITGQAEPSTEPSKPSTDSSAEADAAVEGRYTIEIITIDPGRELFSRWGHICIVVVDAHTGEKLVYNYGTFLFDEPGLLFKYAKGYLNFWLSLMPYRPMIAYYKWENRGIVSRTLDLTDKQAAEVAHMLEENAKPENATYAYRHYLDNCCTRIRDLLNTVLDGKLQAQFSEVTNERTYRYYTRRALTGLPVMRTVILFIMGREIDRPVTRFGEQFLPEVLGEDLDKITVNGRNLVKRRRVIYDPPGPKAGEWPAQWEYIVSIVVMALLILGLGLPLIFRQKKWAVRVAGFGLQMWGLLGGLGGLLLIVFWTLTLHYDCHKNENITVFPFLHLMLVIPGFKLLFKGRISAKSRLFLQKYLIFALGVLALNLALKLGPLFQQNYTFIAFAAVMNLASLAILKYVLPTNTASTSEK